MEARENADRRNKTNLIVVLGADFTPYIKYGTPNWATKVLSWPDMDGSEHNPEAAGKEY